MGRAKQSMKLINEGRIRNMTFRKRKEGLKKKALELSVLCDVQLCLIIRGPPMDGSDTRDLEIWPPNRHNVQSLIHSYNNQSIEDRKSKTENLTTIFEKKRQNIENDLLKLKKKNETAKYTTWDERYSNLSHAQLVEVGNLLNGKLVDARNKIETIKSGQICSSTTSFFSDLMSPEDQPISSLFSSSEVTFPMNYYLPIQETRQGKIEEDLVPDYPLTTMMNNNDSYCNSTSQFGEIYNNNVPYINGWFGDIPLCNFLSPHEGYFDSSDTQMMPSHMQNFLPWEEQQIMQSLDGNQM